MVGDAISSQYVRQQGRTARTVENVLWWSTSLPGLGVIVLGLIVHVWPAVLFGVLLTAGGVWASVAVTKRKGRARRQLRLLEDRGVAATATVTAVVDVVTEDRVVDVSLVISGPAVEPFVGSVRSEPNPDLAVGVGLPATVSPDGTTFTVDARCLRTSPFYP